MKMKESKGITVNTGNIHSILRQARKYLKPDWKKEYAINKEHFRWMAKGVGMSDKEIAKILGETNESQTR